MILVSPEKIKAYVEQGWWTEETMGELFIKTAEQQAQAMAVVDPPNRRSISGDEPQSWTWAQLLTQVGRFCALLHLQGMRKDDVIVMQLPNCVEMHAVYLACAINGIVVSPVPVQYRTHDLTPVFSITQAKLAITTQHIGNYPAAQQWAMHAPLFEGL